MSFIHITKETKAKISREVSDSKPSDHFVDANEMVVYTACYLIVKNAAPSAESTTRSSIYNHPRDFKRVFDLHIYTKASFYPTHTTQLGLI